MLYVNEYYEEKNAKNLLFLLKYGVTKVCFIDTIQKGHFIYMCVTQVE